jgi:hypothetical protein
MTDLGYDADNINYTQEPDYSIGKMQYFEKKYKISSEVIEDKNFQLCDKIPYSVIKEWLSYIDTAQYFNR